LLKNKPRVLVLGKSGMLGHMVMHLLKSDHDLSVFGTQMGSRSKAGYLNVLEGERGLRRIFERNGGFDYCINCIGITANKIKEDDCFSIRRARLINSLFPKHLAEVAQSYGCRVIHISTDGVFRGTKTGYFEDSRPDCSDVYGKTKLAGEINAENFINIRCSIIGPSPYEHGGVWEWFASLPSDSSVYGFTNHIWNGITTLQFSQLCRSIIKKGCFDSLRSGSGVYHFAPNKPLSKYHLLQILKHSLKKNVNIKKSVQGKGKVFRVLHSRFRFLHKLFPYGSNMRQALNQLLAYERKKNE